ncbi:hypothetical protein BJ508DRAFT_304095 [Ascobolus immersus RN42]|uniref:Uncharacterized protein n=1 Tax=Ascobolus immersus RN42 TaxID=1160509 RepID=A0A3N4IGW1_ASCIM|nr:hypothetical protein BJ508DRAFT_304095 [Ascobolus immersus RN42]
MHLHIQILSLSAGLLGSLLLANALATNQSLLSRNQNSTASMAESSGQEDKNEGSQMPTAVIVILAVAAVMVPVSIWRLYKEVEGDARLGANIQGASQITLVELPADSNRAVLDDDEAWNSDTETVNEECP